MEYQVLWIDDNKSQEFIDVASEIYGLDIIHKCSYTSGIEWLKENKDICFAVILDVNCKVDDNSDRTSMDAFISGHKKVLELCKNPLIPWFVYTAGDFEGLEYLAKCLLSERRNWDLGRQYYNKPADRKALLKKVKEAVVHREFYDVLKKYEDVLSHYHNDMLKRLTRILIAIETNGTDNVSIMTDIRKLQEDTILYLIEHGLFPNTIKTLNEAYWFLGEICKKDELLVPKFISYGFRASVEATQNGSHSSNLSSRDGRDNLVVDKLLSANKLPYLIRNTVYEMLNFLTWASLLPQTDEEIDNLRRKIETFNINLKKN